MTKHFRSWVVVACLVLIPVAARAQTIDLATGGADQIWVGTATQSGAGTWLDQGAVSAGDSRRDLIIARLKRSNR